ncbi:flagellar biosynthetic protein FlhB [Granulicella aggregans]|uniref:Flagellar biosynthetic protein FlhB n=1 Tax=Granulicella aggregans TaxID=474949 RepID=A0A7W8E3J0_9BACT|nr:EscU/YscU/HrcU family type III secretion system export apparatus switch protein [Granulicella aggregans]MBB5057632.1 flagellar biosynthetic protein FlhB [Granulicella aggregans]
MADKGTEQATPQRKKKAREDGDFVRSRELLAAVAMLAGVLVLGAMSSRFVNGWMRVYIDSLSGLRNADLSGERGVELVRRTMLPGMAPIAMVMLAAFAGSLVMGLLQGGGIGFHAKSLAFNFDRINPVTNMGHLFSLRSTTRVVKSMVPAGIMAIFGWYGLHRLMVQSPVMSMVRLPQTFSTAYLLALDAAWVALAWSGLDYAIEFRAWNQRLKMTKQQIREEMRDATGNPQIKARVRQIQRAMRRRRVKADMSRASVLITNPTHYAVALEFSFETMQAPTVLAKGRDLHALEMREEARWAGVPIIENPPLARSLYQAVEPGSSIPFALYQAVAGILAFLYRQRMEEKLRADRAAKAAAQSKPAEVAGMYAEQRGGMVLDRIVADDGMTTEDLEPGAKEETTNDEPGTEVASNKGDL